MKSAAFKRIAICAVGVSLNLGTTLSRASSCKCPKPPGGGVQCTDNQIAKCDPRYGECNCSCVSVTREKTPAEYEALILSSVFGTEVKPAEISDEYRGLGFRQNKPQSNDKGEITFSLDFSKAPHLHFGDSGNLKDALRLQEASKVKLGLPGWLGDLLIAKGGVSVGPGASLQNCPNGSCAAGDNSSAVGAITQGAGSALSVNQQGGITAGTVNLGETHPDPHFNWTQEDSTPTSDEGVNPVTEVFITVDGMMYNAAFGAFCDRPCRAIDIIAVTSGVTEPKSLRMQDDAVGYFLMAPNPLLPEGKLAMRVQSMDSQKVHIKQVVRINPKEIGADKRP